MNRKSKEKIVDAIAEGIDTKSQYTSVCEAMQAYADQEMLFFLDWINTNCIQFVGHNCKIFSYKGAFYTTQQLITKYKEENP